MRTTSFPVHHTVLDHVRGVSQRFLRLLQSRV
jgi:hypothetical protein